MDKIQNLNLIQNRKVPKYVLIYVCALESKANWKKGVSFGVDFTSET